ncbi:hypothetical protein SEA_BIRTHDAYBOY_61 [Gordonia phage BirthdayBoy]|uniref:Uncharacterized protein n=7 Tax=Lambovirus TaxID=2843412 RepID=A0A5J6TKT6_9CAUD|nr:hypothetical protein HWC68_gp61 [Gordonia phage Gibbin]YP_009854015.1 hypothetical protein HWC82_gp61 [Gordonia phage Yikes]UVT31039.1 hypothetical protein SEA_PARVUSTARDA_58 [Gordonia phage ParvusTarda]UVT31755.1 hypothetical protein SEA_PATOS_62 [Gordonia phage Patos]WNM65997.1 hypothetical protein SEA_BIRTHDAYBOY_61 [Gordonia phage BirthdayBoy]WNM67205.1 hypothetical protein SEA_ERUTAN_59 [Gordonia phage Erutan]WNN95319.1 hypothetical protein SEA_NORMANRE_62 [Gordonia phage NorManre]WN
MKFAQCHRCGEPCDPVFDTVSVLTASAGEDQKTASGETEIPMCCDCYEEVYGEAGSED